MIDFYSAKNYYDEQGYLMANKLFFHENGWIIEINYQVIDVIPVSEDIEYILQAVFGCSGYYINKEGELKNSKYLFDINIMPGDKFFGLLIYNSFFRASPDLTRDDLLKHGDIVIKPGLLKEIQPGNLYVNALDGHKYRYVWPMEEKSMSWYMKSRQIEYPGYKLFNIDTE